MLSLQTEEAEDQASQFNSEHREEPQFSEVLIAYIVKNIKDLVSIPSFVNAFINTLVKTSNQAFPLHKDHFNSGNPNLNKYDQKNTTDQEKLFSNFQRVNESAEEISSISATTTFSNFSPGTQLVEPNLGTFDEHHVDTSVENRFRARPVITRTTK